LLIIAAIVLLIRTTAFSRFSDFMYIMLALGIALLPAIILMALKPSAFRADFLYGLLPYVLLIATLSIDIIAKTSFQEQHVILARWFLASIVVLSTFPTFISNLLIDEDRLPHEVAAAEIASIPHSQAFAPNPNYFNYYLGSRRVLDIRKANQKYNDSGVDEYFYIPVRKGMTTQFFYDFNLVDGMQLLKILGKDRIDLRSNRIYVFIRKANSSSWRIKDGSDYLTP
jgi:hypothetical protein